MSTPTSAPDGLDLLQRSRPDVVESYMDLLRGLGKALDPRVRQLILISLQVAQGSTRALRRHVPRALEAGATREEVLDAVVLTLPVVGLTRVTDALASLHDLLGDESG